jgi:hypothetical protein
MISVTIPNNIIPLPAKATQRSISEILDGLLHSAVTLIPKIIPQRNMYFGWFSFTLSNLPLSPEVCK